MATDKKFLTSTAIAGLGLRSVGYDTSIFEGEKPNELQLTVTVSKNPAHWNAHMLTIPEKNKDAAMGRIEDAITATLKGIDPAMSTEQAGLSRDYSITIPSHSTAKVDPLELAMGIEHIINTRVTQAVRGDSARAPRTLIQQLVAAVVDSGDDGSPKAVAARALLATASMNTPELSPSSIVGFMAQLKEDRAAGIRARTV